MPEIRKRRVSESDDDETPVRRRRDRTASEVDATDADPEPEEGEGYEDEEPAPRRRSRKANTHAADNADMEDEDDDDPPVKSSRSSKASAVEDDDDDEDRPRRSRSSSSKPKLPPGVHTGRSGAEALRKATGGGAVRLNLQSEPELVKFLEPEPFVSFAQHWVPQGGGGGNRPYTCPVSDCPLCDLGDRANVVIAYNVLHLSAPDKPVNKILQLGVKADRALVDAATSKKSGTVDIERNYFAISRSGKGQQSQTNFKPIRNDDIVEEWEELLDNFDIEQLPDLVADAQENLFDVSIVQVSTGKQLREVAAYLAED